MKKLGTILRESIRSEIKDNIKGNDNAFIVGYSSVSSADFSTLRITLKESGAKLSIVRNALARRTFKESKMEDVSNLIEGPTALIWNIEDPVLISKTLTKFSKDYEGLVCRGGYLDKKIIGEDVVKELSDLPSKETLQVMAVTAIKYPITGLLNALNHNLRQVVNIFHKLSEKKGGE